MRHPHQLTERFRMPKEWAHLSLLNASYLDLSERDEPVLKEGDTLSIRPPVAGGAD
jgi:molybdopterin converting factor small subunit